MKKNKKKSPKELVQELVNFMYLRHLEYGDLWIEWWVKTGQEDFIKWAEKTKQIKLVKLKDIYKELL